MMLKAFTSKITVGALATLLLLATLQPDARAGAYELGLKLYEQGAYEAAAMYFRQALNQQAGNPNLHYYLADSYLKMKRLSEAQAEYQRILTIAPGTTVARLAQNHLAKLRLVLEDNSRNPWHEAGISGAKEAPDRYLGGGIGDDDYMANVLENGEIVRWSLSKMPLKLYVDNAPQGVRNYQPAFAAQIPKAMSVWANVLNNQLPFIPVSNPNEADIRVSWINTIDTRGHNTDGGTAYTAGITLPHVENDQLHYMEVKIATFDIQGNPQTAGIIYAVAVHELGHALGLLGHSANADDIMYAQNQHVIALSRRDINTIRKLYAQAADINNLSPDTREITPGREAEIAKNMEASIANMEKQAVKDNLPLSWLNLGVLYYKKGKDLQSKEGKPDPASPETNPATWFKKAMDATNKTLAMEPNNQHAYHKRALIYQEMGDFGNALRDAQKANSLDRREPEYYKLMAWFHAKEGHVAESRNALDTYLYYRPEDAGDSEVVQIQKELEKSGR